MFCTTLTLSRSNFQHVKIVLYNIFTVNIPQCYLINTKSFSFYKSTLECLLKIAVQNILIKNMNDQETSTADQSKKTPETIKNNRTIQNNDLKNKI